MLNKKLKGISSVIFIIIICLGIFLYTIVFSSYRKAHAFFPMQNGYFQGNKGKGWFWYKHKPKKLNKAKQPQKLDLPVIKKMDVKQLKALLKKELNAAVSNPTEGNVKRWLEVKNIVVERSAKFASMNKYVMTKYPYLAYINNNIGGSSSFKSDINYETKHVNRNKLFSKIKKNMGLVLFYNPNSASSVQEERQLFLVCHDYGFYFRNVNMANHPNEVSRFNIKRSPTIVMFYRHKNGKMQHFILLIGLRTQEAIKKQIAWDYYALVKGHKSLSKYKY